MKQYKCCDIPELDNISADIYLAIQASMCDIVCNYKICWDKTDCPSCIFGPDNFDQFVEWQKDKREQGYLL